MHVFEGLLGRLEYCILGLLLYGTPLVWPIATGCPPYTMGKLPC